MIPSSARAIKKKAAEIYEDFLSQSWFDQTLSSLMKSAQRNLPLKSITVFGCGGTGSWLMPKLVKTINDAERKGLLHENFAIVLVDADTVN